MLSRNFMLTWFGRMIPAIGWPVLFLLSAVGAWAAVTPKAPMLGALGGETLAVEVQGQYAYVGEGIFLTVIDISDPAAPVEVGRKQAAGVVQDIEVSGALAYVSCKPGALQVFNISDPASPEVIGAMTNYAGGRIKLAGSYIYAARYYGTVIDVSNPSQPSKVADFPTPATPFYFQDVDVSGNRAYFSNSMTSHDHGGGFIVYDVTDPVHPALLGAAYGRDDGYNGLTGAWGICVRGTTVYTTDNMFLRVHDASNPAAPALLAEINVHGSYNRLLRYVDVRGGYAFVGSAQGGLAIVNVADPAHPQVTGVRSSPAAAYETALPAGSDLVYCAIRGDGLAIVSAADPASPQPVGVQRTAGTPSSIKLQFPLAFTGNGSKGVQVIDISAPEKLKLLGIFDTPGSVSGLDKVDNLLYVADYSSLTILDITNPAAPVQVSNYKTITSTNYGEAYKVKFFQGKLFVTKTIYNGGTLRVVDVSNPAAPHDVAECPLGGFPQGLDLLTGVTVGGELKHYAYVGAYYSGIDIIDITDPLHPVKAGNFGNGKRVPSIAIWREGSKPCMMIIYETQQVQREIHFYDLSDPLNPVLMANRAYSGTPNSVAVSKGFGYACKGANGFEVFNLQSPTMTTPVITANSFGELAALDVCGSTAYVADLNAGLVSYRLSGVRDEDGEVIEEELPDTVQPGQVVTGVIVLRNYGKQTWGQGVQAGLGVSEDPSGFCGGANQVLAELPGGTTVANGQDGTFTVQLRAPTQPGVYTFTLQPVNTGASKPGKTGQFRSVSPGSFFGQEYQIRIKVGTQANAVKGWGAFE